MDNMLDRLIDGMMPDFAQTCQNLIESTKSFCESPIENLLLAGLKGKILLEEGQDSFAICSQEDMGKHDHAFICVPQFVWSTYRIDIAIANKAFPGQFLFIECDGHDFHERTADQAAYDRSKDRASQIARIPILRFTGREIYRDVGRCTGEIAKAIHALLQEEPHG